jgi:hypothetical protein
MTQTMADGQNWSNSRWWWMIVLVFASQLFLIFWLGRPHKSIPAANDPAPQLGMVGPDAAQVFALRDPTLFALPHSEGFSGPAWLTVPRQVLELPELSEAPEWLALVQNKLGVSFKGFSNTNIAGELPVFAQSDLQLKQPVVAPDPDAFPTQSLFRLTGDLAKRRLLTPLTLTNWPSAEILTNTVVQILVGADGRLVSAPTLLKPRGGPNEADLYALREARKARFEPVTVQDPLNPEAGLAWGQFVFEWHTVPLPLTNSPAETPAPK